MLKADRSVLDYGMLAKKAKRLIPSGGRKLRLALLADVSTQHLVPLLRVLFKENDIDVEPYEAGFDTIELESFDASSGLYRFNPEIVVILQSVLKLRTAYYRHPPGETPFHRGQADRIEGVWQAIHQRIQVPILQSTFVMPYERPWGNLGNKASSHFQGDVAELNREICQRAARHPGVFIQDIDYIAAWVGRRHFLDERLWALAKSLCAMEFLPDVAQNVVDIGLACIGRNVKCVVVDLDNTLWGGVLGDDGMEKLALDEVDDGAAFHSFQCFLRELSRRGIILAVCSKNEETAARAVFEKHPGMVLRLGDIAVFVANWEDKATNLRNIRAQLNIGFDSMVFVDDNPFERNLVRRLIPEIIVPELPEDPLLYVRSLSELNLFEAASFSALDAQRNALYQDQARRETELRQFADIKDYLRSLESVATFCTFQPRDIPRIAQLIQRSNQFNLTTRRYSEAECEAMMRDDAACHPISVTLKDRFGDFGLIGVVILREVRADNTLQIDSFLMSCRVLQRGVEEFAMNRIFEVARSAGLQHVTGRYLPTAKNALVKSFYANFGFGLIADDGEKGTSWSLGTSAYSPREIFIRESD